MDGTWRRRDILRLAGAAGGAAFASALPSWAAGRDEEFVFVQLSNAHWGFEGAPNPDARGTLPKAVAAVNALPTPPDFIMFTGDLTRSPPTDPNERRRRMREFRDLIAPLRAGQGVADAGRARREPRRRGRLSRAVRSTHYTFDHKGCTSSCWTTCRTRPARSARPSARGWRTTCASSRARARIVVFTHRPVRSLSAVGLGHARRRGRGGPAHAVPARHRVLRAYPSGTPPHDRAYRPSRGALADVSAAAGRLAAQARAGGVGTRASPIAGSAGARSRPRARRMRSA